MIPASLGPSRIGGVFIHCLFADSRGKVAAEPCARLRFSRQSSLLRTVLPLRILDGLSPPLCSRPEVGASGSKRQDSGFEVSLKIRFQMKTRKFEIAVAGYGCRFRTYARDGVEAVVKIRCFLRRPDAVCTILAPSGSALHPQEKASCCGQAAVR